MRDKERGKEERGEGDGRGGGESDRGGGGGMERGRREIEWVRRKEERKIEGGERKGDVSQELVVHGPMQCVYISPLRSSTRFFTSSIAL